MITYFFQKSTLNILAIKSIFTSLKNAGFTAFLVGGAVRRPFINLPILDIDITTDATPDQIGHLFHISNNTGQAFGSVTIQHNGITADITTFRTESQYKNSRHPSKVVFANTIEVDLLRRDFTINAIAFNPITQQLIDTTGGIADIKAKQLTCIGDPTKRFKEDTLRLIRLARFAAETNFDIHPNTLAAFMTLGPTCKLPSKKRIGKEMITLLKYPHASKGINLLLENGLLLRLFDSLNKGV